VAPAKRKENEQTALLREILLELRRLNANLEKKSAMPPPATQDMDEPDDGDDSEELDHFE
jgi:hypothetical protein